ncbi:hypothetical protein D9M68_687810 [compost metagenome]
MIGDGLEYLVELPNPEALAGKGGEDGCFIRLAEQRGAAQLDLPDLETALVRRRRFVGD